MRMQLRPLRAAATPVVPEPAKKLRISSEVLSFTAEENPKSLDVLAALLCRHLVQRYAATGDQALHSYPATRFAQIPPASD